jgi:hypothetical protein
VKKTPRENCIYKKKITNMKLRQKAPDFLPHQKARKCIKIPLFKSHFKSTALYHFLP